MRKTRASLFNRLVHGASRLKPMLFGSIKGQLFLVFAATFISVFALTTINLVSMSSVKGRLLLGERYDDLLNSVLEVRRFEKNYLFYNDTDSLQEGIFYLESIKAVVDELSDDILTVTGREKFSAFLSTFSAYSDTIKRFAANKGEPADQERIRQQGKALVEFAHDLVGMKRARVHKAIVRTAFLPPAFLGIFVLLILLVIRLISRGLLRPLGTLQLTIQRVAKGDYSPTPYEGLHTEEMATLIKAFNRMANELETNQEHLLQARKIAALGTFTAGVAHELNNPINNISLTAETYLEGYSERMDADEKELMRDILGQASRAGEIVRNLLDFSRTERAPAFSSFDAVEVIDRTIALVKNQIMIAGIKLDIDIASNLPPIRGNLKSLQQVFMNLLLNAIQAMPAGGEINVGVRAEPGKLVRFDIRDTGRGIDSETQQHIFEPFFTTKEVGRGTGLGLAVAYSITKRYGGRIEVVSEPGAGSVFSVLLPVFEAQDRGIAGDGKEREYPSTLSGSR